MKKLIYSALVLAMTALAFTSCEDVPAPYDIPSDNGGDTTPDTPEEGTYVSETFKSEFGTFTVNTVKGTPWAIDSYGYAKATGYENSSKTTTPSESYLVSEPFDLSASTGAYVQFEYILRYYTNYGASKPGVEDKVLITSNYTGDPTTTTWTDMTGTLTEGSDWNTWSTYSVNIPSAFLGQKNVVVALYYACEDNSATWEVKNLVIKDGEAANNGTDTPDTPDTPTTPTTDGTASNPYSVTDALAATSGTGVYVKGYIVGCVNDKSISSASFDSSNLTSQTNILIAASANETDVNKCMPVQLPAGDVRTALNLKDNPSNYKQEVLLYGNIEKYFGVTGVKSVTYAKLNGTEFGTNPEGGETPAADGYKVATTIADGAYIIAASTSATAYVVATPLAATYNYGYIQKTDATLSNSVLNANADNEFTFKTVSGGYTMQDKSGRYYYMAGTYNSFNVSTDLPASGYIWTITLNSDNTVNIKNVEMGKTIQYSSNYSSYGAYTDISNTLPYLFKK